MAKFELGHLVSTAAVAEKMNSDRSFEFFVHASLIRFLEADWGNVTPEDKATFDQNVKDNQGMLHGVYKEPVSGTVIWIVTEWDRHATTVLFPYEW